MLHDERRVGVVGGEDLVVEWVLWRMYMSFDDWASHLTEHDDIEAHGLVADSGVRGVVGVGCVKWNRLEEALQDEGSCSSCSGNTKGTG